MVQNRKISRALDMLEKGKWGAQKTIDAITRPPERRWRKRASWLRIEILKKSGRKFGIRLPIGLLALFACLLNPVVRHAIRRKTKGLNLRFDLRMLIKMLRHDAPLVLVDVTEGRNRVLISLI